MNTSDPRPTRARSAGRRWRGILAVVALGLAATGCFSDEAIRHQETSPATRPWFCHGEGDGTPLGHHGNGSHLDPWYAGLTKGNLSWDDCFALAGHLDHVRDFAQQWPTRGDAEAAGWRPLAEYVVGIGTHHTRTGFGAPFDPDEPTFLQYGGRGPDAPLVGVSWGIFNGDRPPVGLPGNNDWWHTHPTICRNMTSGEILAGAEAIPDAECTALGGRTIPVPGLYLLHAWMVPGYEYKNDVFLSTHPCLLDDAIAPAGHPCWALTEHNHTPTTATTSTTMGEHNH